MEKSPLVPALETSRLVLRAHRVDDFPMSHRMWADPKVVRFIGGRPFTRQEVWTRMLRYPGLWVLLGYGYWAVEEKATGRFVGEMGFADFKREMDPPLDGIPELGWVLAPEVHGKGYSTEALRAIVAWGDTHLSRPKTACLIHPENAVSVAVAQKLGFREAYRTTFASAPSVIFERAESRSSGVKT